MRCLVLVALLAACVAANFQPHYSFSPPVGSGGGRSYLIKGEGRITAIRVWEWHGSYISGIQLRYGFVWSRVAGYSSGSSQQIELFDDETIIQISGKYSHYVESVVFTTNLGRSLYAGRPSGNSFNLYPEHPQAELVILNGRWHYGMTSIGAHWAVLDPSQISYSNSTRA
ncbi:zymogen granule membrane protein 16-like [Menidia menidia]